MVRRVAGNRRNSMGTMVRVYAALRAMNEMHSPRFYFALPRLLALLRQSDSRRAEPNATEAWAGSIAVFAVTWLFFANLLLPDNLPWWLAAFVFVALPFLILLLWVLALHLNSLILKLLRLCGLFRAL